MWGMDSVCGVRARVSRRRGAGRESPSLRRIEFTLLGKWGILWVRENEENAPRFQRSGKKVGGVCVFGRGDVVVVTTVGFGAPGRRDGLLRWGDVSAARAWAEEKFE